MNKYQRVCIFGNCGAGKSTLAIKLGKMLHLPVQHIDKLYWKSGWVKTPKSEYEVKLRQVINGERWIVDGNNKGTFAERLKRCDLVIYMDYNPLFCCYRVIKRALTTSVRPDMAEGCRERINLPFYKYILNFRKTTGDIMLRQVQNSPQAFDFFIVRDDIETAALLERLGKS